MPELPEVESLRRDLSRTLIGRAIARAEVTKLNMLGQTRLPLESVVGRRIEALERRAKLLLFRLSDGLTMVVHLKLAGQLIHRMGDETLASGGHPVPRFDAPMPHKSTHGRFDLDDGSTLWLTDIRQFGRVIVLMDDEVAGLIKEKKLGTEPLGDEFTVEGLARTLSRHRSLAIKTALLDQANLAGLGNIYADEALHWARIHPLRPAGGLSEEEVARLHASVREVLRYAIEKGVADLPAGKVRDGAKFPRSHGRSGRPCLACGATIERITVGTRSTDFCPGCQS